MNGLVSNLKQEFRTVTELCLELILLALFINEMKILPVMHICGLS